jgi:hypothetical protein
MLTGPAKGPVRMLVLLIVGIAIAEAIASFRVSVHSDGQRTVRPGGPIADRERSSEGRTPPHRTAGDHPMG